MEPKDGRPKIQQTLVIQLDKVSLVDTLSEIAKSFQHSFPSMCGIFRQCDYEKCIKGDTIFIILGNHEEYVRAKINYVKIMQKIMQKSIGDVSFPSCFFGSIKQESVNDNNEHLLAAFPNSVGLFDIKYTDSSVSTAVVQVLKYFENKQVNVTGFKFCMDNNGKQRSFGFLQMFNAEDPSRLLGFHTSNGCSFQVKLNTSISLMLDTSDHELVDVRRNAPLTQEIIRSNKLSTTIKEIALSVIGTDPLHTIRIISYTSSFFQFNNQFLNLIKNFKLVVYIQKPHFSIALVGFESERRADIYKTMFKKMINNSIEDVDHAEKIENEMIQRAQILNIKPSLSDETMYMMGKDEQLLHCLYGNEWKRFSFSRED